MSEFRGRDSTDNLDVPAGSETIRLLERVHAGDQSAVELLFVRFLDPLQRWASGRLPRWARGATDTQDVVQDTLLQTFKRIESFRAERKGALQAYLRQAVLNRITDEIRRSRRTPAREELGSGIVDLAPSPLEETIGREALERYQAALQRLRAEDRDAVIARIEMGWSNQDIATLLGKASAGAARKVVERALVRVAAEMERIEGERSQLP